jgi:CDGSH-type Zn-finger protein
LEEHPLSETTQTGNAAFTVPNGPLIATGDLQIHIADVTPVSQPRASLCRCGASAKKPFCDGSHRNSGWVDAGDAAPSDSIPEITATGPVVFTPLPAGPLLANGPLTIQNAAKETIAQTTEVAFCRCGASANKPYCDGAHAAIGFVG